MKKHFSLQQYSISLLLESATFLFLFRLIIGLIIKLKLQATFRTTLLFSVCFLGLVYFVLKSISQKYSNKPYLSMLPVSYLLGFYLIYFKMFLDNTTKFFDYTEQLALLTLFFIIVNTIDKIIDNFLKNSKEK